MRLKQKIFNRKSVIKILNRNKKRNLKAGDLFDNDIKKIENIFDIYEGIKRHKEKINFAFLVPSRASRHQQKYWDEMIASFPSFKFISEVDRERILVNLPPFIIAYYETESRKVGAVVFSAVSHALFAKIRNPKKMINQILKRTEAAVNFSTNTLNAKYIGLGGVLPKYTRLGEDIFQDKKIVITNGHSGTVWLLCKTFERELRRLDSTERDSLRIGFIGGGAIGSVAMQRIASEHKEFRYNIYDIRSHINVENKNRLLSLGISNVYISNSNTELISNSDIIILAVTGEIHISNEISLSGKIFIDDSQPGSVQKEAIEKKGGKLIWVIGTAENLPKRSDDYKFGNFGLAGNNDLWGCEAELMTIFLSKDKKLATIGNVSSESIERTGKEFLKSGIKVAKPQAFGEYAD